MIQLSISNEFHITILTLYSTQISCRLVINLLYNFPGNTLDMLPYSHEYLIFG